MVYDKLNNKYRNKFWQFMNHFTKPLKEMVITHQDNNVTFYDWNDENFDLETYRKYIIKTISKNYTIQEFYVFELLLETLYWSMKKKIEQYFSKNDIKNDYSIISKKDLNKKTDLFKFGINDAVSKSNSYLQYNEKKNKYYYLKNLNKLDMVVMNIMTDRDDFEFYYNNPDKIIKYKKQYITYHYLNYPFPNANPLFKNLNNKVLKIKKIKKMYYEKNDSHWYKIIK